MLACTKLGHCDLWPLSYRSMFIFAMLTICAMKVPVLHKFHMAGSVQLYKTTIYVKAFQGIWCIWPWPHSQGHSRHLKCHIGNFQVWHILTSLHPETSYFAYRYLRSITNCMHKIRSLWPLTSELWVKVILCNVNHMSNEKCLCCTSCT